MSHATPAKLGRPREFDLNEALEKAMHVFWAQGYDGTSLADLTAAMGISKPSMYAAIGNKEAVFRKVLDVYTAGPASYFRKALAKPTAREVATSFLKGSVRASTEPRSPAGCLGVQGALAASAAAGSCRDALATWRNTGLSHLRDRFQRAIADRDLPSDSDPSLLARYLMTIANGISVQAASGATRRDLFQVADAALRNWPPANRSAKISHGH